MDNVIKTLHIACALSESSNIPGLDVLAKGALKLAEMVKETRDVQDPKLAAAVYYQLNNGISTLDERTAAKYIETLLETLQAVEGVMTRRKKARFICAFWHRGSIAEEVKKLNGQLEDAFRVFDIQSSIHADQQITMLLQCSEHLLQRAEDSERAETALLSGSRRIDSNVQEILHRMRLYARDDIELVEELGSEDTAVEPGEEPVVQFRARICQTGRSVTVRRFARPRERIRDAIATVKKLWHPNIIFHAIGYSREDPDIAFIVNGGTFRGIDKFLWTMQSAGLMYLKSVYGELGWTADEDTNSIGADKDLVVSTDGRVLLDVGCYDRKRLPNTVIHDDSWARHIPDLTRPLPAFSNPLEG
ncbi:hypothetical protein LXA43DRAFT_975495 [Ganoderma leucocontextum]|nr:hypothetical protein LXA43DRAFT_975495 [Ganoderma leucocontextum]